MYQQGSLEHPSPHHDPQLIRNVVGDSNECKVLVDGIECLSLIDTGSMVTTVANGFIKTHFPSLPVYPISDLIVVKGPLDEKLPYMGLVEIELSIPLQGHGHNIGVFPVLVAPDTAFNNRVPLLVGTNVLAPFFSQVHVKYGTKLPKFFPKSLVMCIQALSLRKRHLEKSNGVYGLLRSKEEISIPPRKAMIVRAQSQITIPTPRCLALVQGCHDDSPVIPGVVDLHNSGLVNVELVNSSDSVIRVGMNSVIGQLCQVSLADSSHHSVEDEEFLKQFSLEKLDPAVSSENVCCLKDLLVEQKLAFSQSSLDLGHTSLVTHQINLTNSVPFKERVRRIPPGLYDEVRKHLQEMLESEVIRESNSPWSSNVVLVRKKDGSLRFCIDYRRLNNITVKDAYALPRIEETLDALRGSSWFSTLDLKSGYWQVDIEESDKSKTAFTVGSLGFFECNRLAFGLTNSPATFQRLMQRVLGDLHLKTCLVYIDDVVVFSKSVEEHIQRLREVLSRLREAGLKLKPSKCELLQRRLKYLGHIVSEKGIECNPEGINTLLNWKVPSSVKELQSFLGLASYLRRYVQNFAKIARPLHLLTGFSKDKKGRRHRIPWVWKEEHQTAFEQLIQALTSPPILAYPDYSSPFLLRIDASYEGLGAVLCQEQNGVVKVIAYASRGLKKAELNYSSNKLEFLCLYWAVTKKFHDYLYGNKFVVTTDNNPLTYVLTTAKLDAVGHRWLAELSTYDFKLSYKPGKLNVDADILSRMPRTEVMSSPMVTQVCKSCEVSSEEFQGFVHSLVSDSSGSVSSGFHVPCVSGIPSLEVDWKAEQLKDPVLAEVLRLKGLGKKPESGEVSPNVRPYLPYWDSLKVIKSVLFRHIDDTDVLVLPSVWHSEAFKLLHTDMGHLGRDRTMAFFKQRFFWPGMSNFVAKSIKSCDRCIRSKAPNLPHKAPLNPIVSSQPMELVCVDFLGLESSKGGFENILVVTDHFTKFAQAFPTKNQTASTTAKVLFDNSFVHYGLPKYILSDQGRNFEGKIIQQLCVLNGVKKLRTTPYHPMGNGLCERFNRTLLGMLRTLSNDKKSDWKSYVPKLVHAYNCSKHDSTKFTPFYLMFGREPRLPIDILFGLDHGSSSDVASVDEVQFISKLREQLEYAYSLVSSNQSSASLKGKVQFDKKVRGSVPEIGDRVLLRNVGLRGKQKLADRWDEHTYIVVGQPDKDLPVYSIRREGSREKEKVVHRNLLLPLGPSRKLSSGSAAVSESSSDVEHVQVVFPQEQGSRSSSVSRSLSSSESANDSDSSSADSESDGNPGGSFSSEVQRPPLRRSTRVRRPPKWLQSGDYVSFVQQCSNLNDPKFLFLSNLYTAFLKQHQVLFDRIIASLS